MHKLLKYINSKEIHPISLRFKNSEIGKQYEQAFYESKHVLLVIYFVTVTISSIIYILS